MANSDNVLRGGLTPKHIDVPELLSVLDDVTGPAPVVRGVTIAAGVTRFDVPVADFALVHARATAGDDIEVPVTGVAIALATRGSVSVTGATSRGSVELAPGQAVLVTPDEAGIVVSGEGELFVALPGS